MPDVLRVQFGVLMQQSVVVDPKHTEVGAPLEQLPSTILLPGF